MKIVKKALYLFIIAVIVITLGYFITSFTQFKSNINLEVFRDGYYITKDENGFISFGSFNNMIICINDNYYFISEVNYDNGIFILEDRDKEETYYKLGVVNENVIYSSSFNTYFYNITLFSEE